MNLFLTILGTIIAEPIGGLFFWIIGGRKEKLILALFNYTGWKTFRNYLVGSIIECSIYYLFYIFI
jgi:hypothetical protein